MGKKAQKNVYICTSILKSYKYVLAKKLINKVFANKTHSITFFQLICLNIILAHCFTTYLSQISKSALMIVGTSMDRF